MGLGDISKKEGSAQDFGAIPAGLYTAMISRTEMSKAKSGADMLKVMYKIIDGPEGSAEPKKFAKRTVWEQFPSNADFRMDHLIQMARASGYDYKSGEFEHNQLINNPIKIRVKVVKYNDEDKNDVIGGSYYKWEGVDIPEEFLSDNSEKPSESVENAELPFE